MLGAGRIAWRLSYSNSSSDSVSVLFSSQKQWFYYITMCEQAIYFPMPSSRQCHWELLLLLVKSCFTRLCCLVGDCQGCVEAEWKMRSGPCPWSSERRLFGKIQLYFFPLLCCLPGQRPWGTLSIWSNKYETSVCVNCFVFLCLYSV